jgi:hypothetical protein
MLKLDLTLARYAAPATLARFHQVVSHNSRVAKGVGARWFNRTSQAATRVAITELSSG